LDAIEAVPTPNALRTASFQILVFKTPAITVQSLSAVTTIKLNWVSLDHKNEQLQDLYTSPHKIQFMKSRTMRWMGRVGRSVRREMNIEFWWRNTMGKGNL